MSTFLSYSNTENKRIAHVKLKKTSSYKLFFLDLGLIEHALFSLEIVSLLLRRCDHKKKIERIRGLFKSSNRWVLIVVTLYYDTWNFIRKVSFHIFWQYIKTKIFLGIWLLILGYSSHTQCVQSYLLRQIRLSQTKSLRWCSCLEKSKHVYHILIDLCLPWKYFIQKERSSTW